MKRQIFTISLAVSLLVVFATASADVIVFTNKFYEEGTIKEVTEEKIVLQQQYGSVGFDRKMVAGFYYTTEGKKGEEYYQAGLTMLRLGDTTRASLLFDKASKYNKKYYALGQNALNRAYGRTTTSEVGTVGVVGGESAIGTTPVRVECKFCNGTGKVEYESAFGSESKGGGFGGERKLQVSCFACGGKGYKMLNVPKGYGLCPDCGGMGMVSGDKGGGGFGGGSMGSGWGSSSGSGQGIGIKSRYAICQTCRGRGYVKGGQAVTSAQQGYGPVAGGPGAGSMRPPGGSGPGGLSSVRSWDEAEGEEEVKEEEKEEEKPKGDPEKSWLQKNLRWVLIGGGAALLIVAITVTKMGAKNKG